MKLRLRQKMKISQNNLKNWNDFAAKTKNVFVLEQNCGNALSLQQRQKMKWSLICFEKRSEFAAKAENDIVLE